MAATTWWANAQLALLLNGTPIPGIADNAASGALTNVYVSLHTADPGLGGNQSTSEISYTGYSRALVARTPSGWTISGNVANSAALVAWPTASAGSGTATFYGVGDAASGAGHLFFSGALSPTIPISTNVTPQMPASSLTVT
jgi:hypothetical protein